MKKPPKIRRKPRVGDFFTIDGVWGFLDLKVTKVEVHNKEVFVGAAHIDISFLASRIIDAEWVLDKHAARIELEMELARARVEKEHADEQMNLANIRRELEVEEALGVDQWEANKPSKGFVEWKGQDKRHKEVLTEIRRLKKLEPK